MLGLCLARGSLSVAIAASQFQLSWTHSIEKVRWEEHWRVTPTGLVIDEALVRGSGAGMEPPEGAVLRDGVWHYRPALPPQASVTLAASGFTPDHTLCTNGLCKALQAWIGGDGPVRLQACETRAPLSAPSEAGRQHEPRSPAPHPPAPSSRPSSPSR
jgi:hypothetical protein